MVLLHILSKNEEQANEIVSFLVDNKLILNAVMQEKVVLKKKAENGLMETESQILIMGKTKSLLFNRIDKELRAQYKEQMPVLYSLPIVSMDWKQTDELVEQTVKV